MSIGLCHENYPEKAGPVKLNLATAEGGGQTEAMACRCPFRLQYLSDIHLEFHDKKGTGNIPYEMFVRPVAPYLALCGDIGIPEKSSLIKFLAYCAQNFKEVYWVPGNHEFYNYDLETKSTVDEKLRMCETICDGFKNVHFMHRKVRQVPGWNLRIAGCTMWTEIRPEDDEKVMLSMNDSRQIYVEGGQNALPCDMREWHEADKAWLEKEILRAEVAQEDLIVLTHHLPTYKLVHRKYEGHPLNFCFAVNLEQLMRPPVRAWLCGHSHTGSEVTVNGVRCSLNPHGYPGEPGTGYSREKVLEIICDSYDESLPCDGCGGSPCGCDESCFGECDD